MVKEDFYCLTLLFTNINSPAHDILQVLMEVLRKRGRINSPLIKYSNNF